MSRDADGSARQSGRAGGGLREGKARPAAEIEIEALYKEHAPLLLKYACVLCGNLEMARDALQEAFFRFHLARARGHAIREPRAWLFAALARILKEEASREEPNRSLRAAAGVPAPEAAPGLAALPGAVRRALSPREAECVEYRRIGYTQEETAAAMNVSPGTVASLTWRAIRKIQKIFRDER